MLTYLLYLQTYLLVHFKSILKIVARLKPYSKLTIEHRASVYDYRVSVIDGLIPGRRLPTAGRR